MAAPLLPTRYVNVAAAVTYSDLPDPLFRTYIRLVGLAWRDREHGQTQLPPLTLGELALVCHCRERGLRLHLQALERAELIAVTGPASALHIRIRNPDVQKFAPPVVGVAIYSPISEVEHQQQSPDVQNFAHAAANCAALETCGVAASTPAAQTVAALPHVTPDFIAAWHAELVSRADVRDHSAYLLHVLSTSTQPPRAETRGGARAASAESSAPAPPAAELPPALHELLDELGFIGPRTALTAQYAADPQFVTAWIEHCCHCAPRYKNPPGYLRNALRGDAYPPATLPLPLPPSRPLAPPPDAAQTLWQTVLADLELQMTRATFDTWLRGTRAVERQADRLVIGVKSEYAVAWLTNRLRPLIERTLNRVADAPLTPEFVVAEEAHA